ncbi:hypothetical protein ACC730_38295, partial [Rhizobium ruizarguesonis]
ITVEEVEDGSPGIEYPRFVDGQCRAPPEDVGSTSGFEEFLGDVGTHPLYIAKVILPRDGRLCIFMPPVERIEDYLELI